MSEWTIGAVLDAVADTVPDRVMTVCGTRRSTFAESADRTRRLADYLAARGFGAQTERGAPGNWEGGQDRVALVMLNDLYPDMVIACLKARVVPVNVNHYYTPREVSDLLAYVKPRGVIYHRSLGDKVGDAAVELLIAIDDGSCAAELDGAVRLEDALAQGDSGRVGAGSPEETTRRAPRLTPSRSGPAAWYSRRTAADSLNRATRRSAGWPVRGVFRWATSTMRPPPPRRSRLSTGSGW